MTFVASQLIEEVTAHAQVAVSRMRERYAQTVLTFRITYVHQGVVSPLQLFRKSSQYIQLPNGDR